MRALLEGYLPEGYIDMCFQLWKEDQFSLMITKDRKTKAGDYRYHPQKKSHTITINHGLNPYHFLITYLHEVAHMQALKEYGHKIAHHGKEWKMTFKKLLLEVLCINQLPSDVAAVLAGYAKNPKASSYSDPELVMTLAKYNSKPAGTYLMDLNNGQEFNFKGRQYKMIKTKRTRVLCERIDNRKKYLIPGHAEVTSSK